jgi:membrane protease YdiL (CAAX protease family)
MAGMKLRKQRTTNAGRKFPAWQDWWAFTELVIVLAITMPLYNGWSLPDGVLRWLWGRPVPTDEILAGLLLGGFNAAVVLVVIRLSGEPWVEFGITKLNGSIDILHGCFTFIISYFLGIAGVDIFLEILKDAFGRKVADQLSQQSWDAYAQAPTGFLALLGLSIMIGVSEELWARGYLLRRLEHITSRPGLSVLVSAVIFGCAHSNGGIVLVWNGFLTGLVLGAAFVFTRSLWPSVIAHVMLDFVALVNLPR